MSYEFLTLWFLRLNGYFCVPNFIIHPDAPGPQRTDADILAVRFPHCSEVAGAPLPQNDSFVVPDRIDFLIAEVKSGRCQLNGPWADPTKGNVEYVLRWMGFVDEDSRLQRMARALYQEKWWRDSEGPYGVRIACFGRSVSDAEGMKGVLQRTHLQSIHFMIDRFRRFDTRKADHKQWDPFIRKVFAMADQGASAQDILGWMEAKRRGG